MNRHREQTYSLTELLFCCVFVLICALIVLAR
jgi:hypothetical protein